MANATGTRRKGRMDDVKRCFNSSAVDCPRKAVSHILREERRNCEGGTKQRKIGRINPLCGEHCVSSGMRGGQHTLRKGGSGERSNIAREGCREERESAKARGMGVPGCSRRRRRRRWRGKHSRTHTASMRHAGAESLGRALRSPALPRASASSGKQHRHRGRTAALCVRAFVPLSL